jgi:ATP-dependent DNA helicase RecG
MSAGSGRQNTAMKDLPPPQAADRLAALLKSAESRTLDFKRLGAGKIAKMLETICAFANTEGGVLAIGIGDAKELRTGEKPQQRLWGIQENPEALDELQRKCRTQFIPPVDGISVYRLPCTLRDGKAGDVVLVRVEKSDRVHSVVDGGTWTRGDASNRQLGATEITELSYQRGERSAESEPVAIPLRLLDTPVWHTFVRSRGLRTGDMAEQMQRIGLADTVKTGSAEEQVQPRRAAVLLFAEEPGSLLAASGTRADIRLLVYAGKEVGSSSTPNLRKPPKTLRGPLIEQIDAAVRAVLDELAQGLTLVGSGFKTRHRYPERVVKEAIVNAVIHRDYHLNRDIFIRIFDDRIEVESPGTFPGRITPDNIRRASSKARNLLVAQNLREFPSPPNIDAGEGVRMMFAEMAAAQLYPPQYSQNTDTAVESVTVTLLNLERPSAWDEVSDWIDREGSIQNAKLCEIAKIDTLKASKMLGAWREQGLLVPLPDRAKRNMAYTKPTKTGASQASLLSNLEENNEGNSK